MEERSKKVARFRVEKASYFSQHDIVYKVPSRIWQDGFPMGNGDVCALAYIPEGFEWGITKVDVWDRRFDRNKHQLTPHDKVIELIETKNFQKLREIHDFEGIPYKKCPYPNPKPCGKLRINFSSVSNADFLQRLSIYDAITTHSYQSAECEVNVSSFVDACRNLTVIKWTENAEESVTRSIELHRWTDSVLGEPIVDSDGKYFWVDYTFPDGFRYVMLMAIDGVDYEIEKVANTVKAKLSSYKEGEFVVLLSMVTSRESNNPFAKAKEIVDEALAAGYNKLLTEHKDWWHSFWSKSFVDLNDKFIENLYYFQLYLLASSSRGSQAPQLFSPWYMDDTVPWHGDYHGDVNIQQTYWPIFASNHIELGEPYFKTFYEMLPTVKRETKEIFRIDGAKYPVSSIDTGEELSGLRWRYMHHMSAWFAELYWWHYLYTLDEQALENRGYVVMREVARFYQTYLKKDEKGRYYVYPSNSPEQGDWWVKNPTIDIALIKELLEGIIKASEILDVDEEERAIWKEIVDNLSFYPNNGEIFLDYEGADANLPLAHPALLTPVFTAGDIGLDSSQRMYNMAKKTFDGLFERSVRKTQMPFGVPTWNDDMSWPWIICIAARLGLGEVARSYLYDIPIFQSLKPNGVFSRCSGAVVPQQKRVPMPFMLNSSSGFAAAINEMLIQSYNGIIRVFPAVPKDWDCRIADFRVVGAFLVSSEIVAEEVKYIMVKSLAGEKCKVANPWKEENAQVRNITENRILMVSHEDILSFKTIKEHVYVVERRSKPLESFKADILTGKEKKEPRKYEGPKYLAATDIGDGYTTYLGKSMDWKNE